MSRKRDLVPLLVLACSCFGESVTPFPDGLEPLEQNRASFPIASADEPFPERLSFSSLEREGVYSTHARGYLLAPVSSTWLALQVPEVVTDRRKVDESSATLGLSTGAERNFVIHNVVHDLITVEFDMTWRLGIVAGSEDEPEVVAARFQKTFGSNVIKTLRGSMVLRAETEEVTSIELVEHLEALSGDSRTLESYLLDLFDSVAAHSRGRPLPTYTD